MKKEIVPEQIGFRISEKQYNRIKENADRFKLPVSIFILRSALNKFSLFCKVAEQFSILTDESEKYKKLDTLCVEKYGADRTGRLHFGVTAEQYYEIERLKDIYGYDNISHYVVEKATEPYAIAYNYIEEVLGRLQQK
jgi:uncharacterized protein (DUF1778 family)